MAYKSNDKCFQNADEDEPIFTIRAQDKTAPDTVQDWINRNPQAPDAKLAEAYGCIQDMYAWQQAHPDRVKMAD